MNNRERGFTLIELLVVIAIIGILSSVVLASLNSARQKGRDARRISDLKQLQLALELFYDANGSVYPLAATEIDVSAMPTGLSPNYISSLPDDPTATNSYRYITDSGASTYCLGAEVEVASNASDACTGSLDVTGVTGDTYKVGP